MARKRGMQYIPYDYEAAYNKAMHKRAVESGALYPVYG